MRFPYSHFITVIMVVLATAAVGAVGYIVYGMSADRSALSELQSSYVEAEQRQAYSASVHALLRDLDADRTKMNAITKGYDPVEVIHTIEDAGRSARVAITVNAVTPSAPAGEDPTLSSYSINLMTNGPFDRLYQFIALLETLPLPSSIEQFRLEKIEKTWNMNMMIRVYADAEND